MSRLTTVDTMVTFQKVSRKKTIKTWPFSLKQRLCRKSIDCVNIFYPWIVANVSIVSTTTVYTHIHIFTTSRYNHVQLWTNLYRHSTF